MVRPAMADCWEIVMREGDPLCLWNPQQKIKIEFLVINASPSYQSPDNPLICMKDKGPSNVISFVSSEGLSTRKYSRTPKKF